MLFSFFEYMKDFEERIIAESVKQGCLGKEMQVPVRDGKLAWEKFGKIIGGVINSKEPFVMDYYGFLKKSQGFYDLLKEFQDEYPGAQVKNIVVKVVYFAGLKMEKLDWKISPNLEADFMKFKKLLLDLRGFENEYKVIV